MGGLIFGKRKTKNKEYSMDKETVECMSKVSAILAKLKVFIKDNAEDKVYQDSRDMINDCQFLLAVHCDCAPIKLIAGRVDEVYENFKYCELQKNSLKTF